MQVRLTAVGVLATGFLAANAAAASPGTPPRTSLEATAAKSADGGFCTELRRIDDGIDEPGDVPPFVHLTRILELLIPKASDTLRGPLTEMHDTFAAVASASSQGAASVLPAFAALGSPKLIDVEHRIANGIKDECGIVLGDPAKWPKDTAHGTVPAGADRPACLGWTSQTNAILNNRFPFTIDTSGANYWGFNYKVVSGGSVEMSGPYPKARYFSMLPNDMHTDNLHQLTDIHIDPDPGSANPWRTEKTGKDAPRYTIHFVFGPPPPNPAPNTSYIGLTKHGEPNAGGIFVYRIYGSDLGDQPNSAGQPLPAITVRGPDGRVTQHFDECQPYPKPLPVAFEDVPNFPPLPLPGSYVSKQPKLSESSNYNLPVDLLANPDVQYASLFFGHRYGPLFVIHAKAFTSPDTRNGEPRSKPSDIQGWTMCNYNVLAGIALTCRMDHDLKIDKDGFYTAVVSSAADRPHETETTKDANWFDWGPYLDNQVVWRFFPRDNRNIQALTAALAGGPVTPEVRPYLPVGVYCDKATFEEGGWGACAKRAGMQP
ncbi:MAG TPA: hypothetical protein VL899_02980 [Alphaproteobacteria bacterium]|jgi:hypothetical protein|nr:hypothetical protein [Alphaproteobacteria bacterium]